MDFEVYNNVSKKDIDREKNDCPNCEQFSNLIGKKVMEVRSYYDLILVFDDGSILKIEYNSDSYSSCRAELYNPK